MILQVPRPLRRVVTRTAGLVAGIVTLAALTVGSVLVSVSPDGPPDRTGSVADAAVAQAVAPGPVMFPLFGRASDGHLYDYEPTGTGGWQARVDMGAGYAVASAFVQANVSDSGKGNDVYYRVGGSLYYTAERGSDTKLLGTGWDAYNLILSVGNMGGSVQPDLLARDTSGVIWLYQGKPDGTLQTRIRMKNSTGWNGMSVIAGRGDYTGDGLADLVTRNSSGNLLIYPGTGSATADAVLGTTITAATTGWNDYVSVFSTGDNNGDGKTDLIAVDAAGALWLYKGTGSTTGPFSARVQIGTSGWTAYNALF